MAKTVLVVVFLSLFFPALVCSEHEPKKYTDPNTVATFIELRDVFIHSQFSGINIQMRSHDALQHAQQLYDNLAPYLFHNIQSGDNKAHFMMLLRKSPYFDPLVREINRMQVQKENL